MADLKLVIGSKNSSSWSLRPWLLLKQAGLVFEEILIPLRRPETAREIARYSPSGKVPVLLVDGVPIWDSLAICEFAAEQIEGLWPEDARARALARSVSAEMHAGFPDLRTYLPMDVASRFGPPGRLLTGVARDVERIQTIWRECRQLSAAQGPFLFGHFTVADAMYAPVAFRFHTYQIPLNAVASAYVRALIELPAMQAWAAAARAETSGGPAATLRLGSEPGTSAPPAPAGGLAQSAAGASGMGAAGMDAESRREEAAPEPARAEPVTMAPAEPRQPEPDARMEPARPAMRAAPAAPAPDRIEPSPAAASRPAETAPPAAASPAPRIETPPEPAAAPRSPQPAPPPSLAARPQVPERLVPEPKRPEAAPVRAPEPAAEPVAVRKAEPIVAPKPAPTATPVMQRSMPTAAAAPPRAQPAAPAKPAAEAAAATKKMPEAAAQATPPAEPAPRPASRGLSWLGSKLAEDQASPAAARGGLRPPSARAWSSRPGPQKAAPERPAEGRREPEPSRREAEPAPREAAAARPGHEPLIKPIGSGTLRRR